MGRKKPKIEISEHISRINFKGEENYFFKFVNKTDSELFDVRVEATFFKPVGDLNGTNLQGTDITLKDSFFMYIPKPNPLDQHNLHCIKLRTTENLEEKWTDDSSKIRLTIIGRHALSGFNQVFYKEFNSKRCITSKEFISGDSLEVK
ncbi:hypothetical protein [Algoriphagus formosus]|uniref:Major sperm protein n=1 Tax=Algoriphagus formosus TaxID=2007308 RepID=A0A4R5V850_9BACT|nr:hypothetical protein [Algoriphagus aquimaris]TDK48242.1 hypothetical protein E1898_04290 [Algoriphagus aquimaris]